MQSKRLLTVVCILALCAVGHAQKKEEMPASENPTELPDRIVAGLSGDPATEFTVSWFTGEPVNEPLGQIVPAFSVAREADEATTITATLQPVALPDGQVHYYEVSFGNLNPSTTYTYRVGSKKAWSEWFDYTTASDKPQPFRFIYFGDPQLQIRSMCSRVFRNAFLRAPDARLFVFAGDLVNQGYSDRFWAEFADAMSFIPAMRLILPSPGNHEMTGLPKSASAPATKRADGAKQPAIREVTPHWQAQFELPENAPEGMDTLKEETYYVDYQGVRFISINSNLYFGNQERVNSDAPKQTEWLIEALEGNPNKWAVVMHHHPVFSFGQMRDNENLRETLAPIYEKYGVDLVLTGHDHVYARSHKVLGEQIADVEDKAPIYCISVSGPKMYGYNPKYEGLMAKTIQDTQMYQVIEVNGDKLSYNAYSVDGKLQDAFEIQKTANGSRYENLNK